MNLRFSDRLIRHKIRRDVHRVQKEAERCRAKHVPAEAIPDCGQTDLSLTIQLRLNRMEKRLKGKQESGRLDLCLRAELWTGIYRNSDACRRVRGRTPCCDLKDGCAACD